MGKKRDLFIVECLGQGMKSSGKLLVPLESYKPPPGPPEACIYAQTFSVATPNCCSQAETAAVGPEIHKDGLVQWWVLCKNCAFHPLHAWQRTFSCCEEHLCIIESILERTQATDLWGSEAVHIQRAALGGCSDLLPQRDSSRNSPKRAGLLDAGSVKLLSNPFCVKLTGPVQMFWISVNVTCIWRFGFWKKIKSAVIVRRFVQCVQI